MHKATRAALGAIVPLYLTAAGGCSSLVFTVANIPAHYSAAQRRADIAYGSDARQKLDIYELPAVADAAAGAGAASRATGKRGAPARVTGPRPVIIFWYGGAWDEGKKSDYRFVGTALAEQGYVVVLPDYRLFPQVKFPDYVDDGAQAVAWVEQHIQQYGGDPSRIVLMGHSAGAQLAALVALEPLYLAQAGATRAPIRAFIGLSGPYALVPDDAVLNTIFAAPYTSRDWQPLQHADASAPPTLLLHGLADKRVFPIQTQQLHDALAVQGVHVEMELYPGASHADTIQGFSAFRRNRAPTLERVLRFLGELVPAS